VGLRERRVLFGGGHVGQRESVPEHVGGGNRDVEERSTRLPHQANGVTQRVRQLERNVGPPDHAIRQAAGQEAERLQNVIAASEDVRVWGSRPLLRHERADAAPKVLEGREVLCSSEKGVESLAGVETEI